MRRGRYTYKLTKETRRRRQKGDDHKKAASRPTTCGFQRSYNIIEYWLDILIVSDE